MILFIMTIMTIMTIMIIMMTMDLALVLALELGVTMTNTVTHIIIMDMWIHIIMELDLVILGLLDRL